jgi:hypothetical protein
MGRDELERHDKQRAAVHEIAHAVVAAEYGVHGVAWLVYNRHGGLGEKFWTGSFSYATSHLEPAQHAAVAVAGMVAEEFDGDAECRAEELMEYWESEVIEPSPTDMDAVPDEVEQRLAAVREALRILRKRRDLFERWASHIVENELLRVADLAVDDSPMLPVTVEKPAKGNPKK